MGIKFGIGKGAYFGKVQHAILVTVILAPLVVIWFSLTNGGSFIGRNFIQIDRLFRQYS